MDAKKIHLAIRLAVMQQETSETKLAPLVGMTQQGLNRKLRTGSLRAGELLDVLHALGYKVTATNGDDAIDL